MTIKSHRRGSEGSHKRKTEDSKANGICRRMIDEEYEREKVEIEVCLGVLMELLQKEEEDQRCGFLMRKKLKWHKLQKRKEQLRNAQWEDEMLKASEYLGEDLKTETSSEAKRSQCFKSDILCMSAGTMNEGGQFVDVFIQKEEVKQNLNSVLEENETAGSHVHAHTKPSETNGFQPIV
jgi:hypothetical protein